MGEGLMVAALLLLSVSALFGLCEMAVGRWLKRRLKEGCSEHGWRYWGARENDL